MTYRTREDEPGADDAALVREVADGSHEALATLYDRHIDVVYATARRVTNDRQVAEEVVQETFLALWNRAELFDPGSGSLATWLRAIARNRAVDRIRAAGRRPTLVAPSSAAWADEPDADALERMAADGPVVAGSAPEEGPEAAAESASVREAIRLALTGLREEERTVIVLAYDLDLSQSEIAEKLGWPIGTVKTRTRRALAHLREALGPELAPELGLVGAASARRNADGSR